MVIQGSSGMINRGCRLLFNSNCVFSKAFSDDTDSRSAYNWKTEKAQQQDPTHTINVLLVYTLPFGNEKFTAGAKAVDAVISGWQISSITTFGSGSLLSTIAASCNLPNAGSCYADYAPGVAASSVRINGDYGSGDVRSTP